MNNGFIQLHRKISTWGWYTDANTFRLFIHLLLNANHNHNRWQGIDIQRGQLVTGRKQLATELDLSEQQIRTSLAKLIKTSEITSKATNKFSLVTIVNYDSYQSKPEKATNKHTSKQPTDNQQVTTNNNENKDNNKGIWIAPSGLNEAAWKEFEAHRKIINKPMSNLARTKAANKLKEFTFQEQQKAIDDSIEARWPGVYPKKLNGNDYETSKGSGGNGSQSNHARYSQKLQERIRNHRTTNGGS